MAWQRDGLIHPKPSPRPPTATGSSPTSSASSSTNVASARPAPRCAARPLRRLSELVRGERLAHPLSQKALAKQLDEKGYDRSENRQRQALWIGLGLTRPRRPNRRGSVVTRDDAKARTLANPFPIHTYARLRGIYGEPLRKGTRGTRTQRFERPVGEWSAGVSGTTRCGRQIRLRHRYGSVESDGSAVHVIGSPGRGRMMRTSDLAMRGRSDGGRHGNGTDARIRAPRRDNRVGPPTSLARAARTSERRVPRTAGGPP